jgi:negative regulator of flagellin synthesis FlgM
MTTIDNATSSPPLQPTGSPVNRSNTGATDATSGNAAANAPSSASTGSAGAAGSASTSSTVPSLSSISTQLQAAKVAAGDSVFSTDKVNEIKAAIADGRFKVNSEKVANALLDSVHDLLGSRSRG